MSNEEIRKLLGGYATNTLTEAERQALFEAALENQELFNALQEEEALKDLLEDPVSREQIRAALAQPSAGRARVAWWSRWWAWTGAATAVAAAVLMVVVLQRGGPETSRRYASLETAHPSAAPRASGAAEEARFPEPALQAPKADAPKKSLRESAPRRTGVQNEPKDELARALPPPPPASVSVAAQQTQAPAAENTQSASGPAQQGHNQAQNQVMSSLRDQEARQVGAAPAPPRVAQAVAVYPAGQLTYSLLKRDPSGNYQPFVQGEALKPGDAVRLMVAPPVAGYLSLSRQDASGAWRRIYPQTPESTLVNAKASYTVPDSPIIVQDTDQKLRLSLLPASGIGGAVASQANQRTQVAGARAKSAPLKKQSGQAALEVDLTIGPRP